MGKIVINADDFGMSVSVNEAICHAFQQKHINQTTLLVTHSCATEAMQKARDYGFINQVGLHLNLDAGRPLTEDILQYSLFNDSKSMAGFWDKSKRINRLVIFNPKIKRAIKKEIEAQMERYIELGGTSMHIDSHHHRHVVPSILPIVIAAARKYGFKTMRIAWNHHQSMGGLNLFLKKRINTFIRRYFSTTVFFCNYDDYQAKPILGADSVEIMVHPDVIDGKYVDVVDRDEGIYRDIDSYMTLSDQ